MYVGIDVGGTNLKAGLVDEMGRILAVERTPLDFRGPEAFAATLAELSRAVMDAGGAETSQVEYVGVGLPTDTWSLANFSVEDYNALYEKVKNGEVKVDDNYENLEQQYSNLTLKIS